MKNYHLDDLRRAVATHPVFANQAALINALEIELARVTRELAAANATLIGLGYTYNGGEQWKPPVTTSDIARTAGATLALYHRAREERDSIKQLSDHRAEQIEDLHDQLAALSYPVQLHTHPLLTVEADGIRYVLEVMSDEDGEWFEVKSATPTEAMEITDFVIVAGIVADGQSSSAISRAREALAQYRAAQREDDEASRAY